MKTQKQQGAKAHRGETSKVNLTLTVEAYRRLFVTSIMSDRTASSIVEDLISEGLKSWSMPANLADRVTRRQNSQSVDIAGPVESVAEIAA